MEHNGVHLITRVVRLITVLGILASPTAVLARGAVPQFEQALVSAESALERGALDEARRHVERALERDAFSPRAWRLRAELAGAAGEKDEQIYSLCRELDLLTAQGAAAQEVRELRARLRTIHPLMGRALGLVENFLRDLESVARRYEKMRRPHSAIRAHQRILALDPGNAKATEAIARLSGGPDPSLAETAHPRDLLADVSRIWIEKFDDEHDTWANRARRKTPCYEVHTDAGYEILVRTSEALERIHRLYRRFYGLDDRKKSRRVPSIQVHVFRTKETYLREGGADTETWSAGQYTGSAVMVCAEDDGFEDVLSSLFHEVAHQFVSLTNRADGWLNEAQATFFESCRILPNGAVLTNLPNDRRLTALARRMGVGWMDDHRDGIVPDDPTARPPEAPRIRTIIESRYEWGPAWYSPVWGLIYFLHNYQDPVDGRFVYRRAFWRFVNESKTHVGPEGVTAFEEMVLAHPAPPARGDDRSADAIRLPRRVEDLDDLWKTWIRALKAERRSPGSQSRPWAEWAANAILRKESEEAREVFERGLSADPDDVGLMIAFSGFLAREDGNRDRAACILARAIELLCTRGTPDREELRRLRLELRKLDPLDRRRIVLEERLSKTATDVVRDCEVSGLPMLTMYFARRFGQRLGLPDLAVFYQRAARERGEGLGLWRVLYNERDLGGWEGAATVFRAEGSTIVADQGASAFEGGGVATYGLRSSVLPSDSYSIEAEFRVEASGSPFAGLFFAQQGSDSATALAYVGPGFVLQARDESGVRLLGQFPLARPGPGWHRVRIDVLRDRLRITGDGCLLFQRQSEEARAFRGRFGLLAGPGRSSFRNVRYRAWESWETPASGSDPVAAAGTGERVLLGERGRDGWVEQPPGRWSFTAGRLVASSRAGEGPTQIVYAGREFGDFRLRCQIEQGSGMAAFGARIARHGQPGGRVVVRLAGDWFEARPWNDFEAILSGSTITVKVNGEVVFSGPASPGKGALAFAVGPGGAIGIRDVRVIEGCEPMVEPDGGD